MTSILTIGSVTVKSISAVDVPSLYVIVAFLLSMSAFSGCIVISPCSIASGIPIVSESPSL